MRTKTIFSSLAMLILLLASQPLIAQVNPQNLSNVRVDELSDDQIRSFLRQAQAGGIEESQLEQFAQTRGMRPEEIQKLRARIKKLNEGDKKLNAETDPNMVKKIDPNGRNLNFEKDSIEAAKDPETEAEKAFNELRSRIFGADLFNNKNLTFEPNLSIATPQNYVIGPYDEILIELYGNSEASYKPKVSPEGNITIEYVGLIPVSGLTVEAATSRIRSRMSTVYPGLRTGNTKLNISIGNIRSIKVIVTGEVQKPGTYTVPSLATVFNALHFAGGPTEKGSYRIIELVRGGKVISRLDIYDFLMRGEMSGDSRLQDQDIIRVPVYTSRMEVVGEVKHPGIFELKGSETFSDLLRFTGGFSENAYKSRVKVLKNTDSERKMADLTSENFSHYRPETGDKYFVDRVLERFANRVTVEGAVFRPGQYELVPGLTLSSLLKKAEGLREDAFLERGYITRLSADNQIQLESFSVSGILNGTAPDIVLKREDVVSISSIFDLKEEYKVVVDGEVRQPGTFDYGENMTLEDLIIKAGGFTEGASAQRIEISRRVKDSDIKSASAITATVFHIDVDKGLKFSQAKFELQPFDIISVRNAIGYEVQRQVKIEGEVLYPGMYTIANRDERISDLVKRAGGLTALAYARGASLKRDESLKGKGKNAINQTELEKDKIEKLQRLQESAKDSTTVIDKAEILKNDYVGINLDKIIENPRTETDLILEEGDVLSIPKYLQTVKVSGEILYPVTTTFADNRGFKYYISQGGGFSNKSLKKRSYVIYANGSVKSTSKIFFFNNYPRVEPGAELFVPEKDTAQKLSAQELLGITTGIASLGAIILGILNLTAK